MAIPQGIGVLVVGGCAIPVGHFVRIIEPVSPHAQRQNPAIGQVDGIHDRNGHGIDLVVGGLVATADVPLDQVVDVAHRVAVRADDAVTSAVTAATGNHTVGVTGVGQVVAAVLDLVTAQLGAEYPLVPLSSQFGVPVQVGDVGQVLHFLPAIVTAQGNGFSTGRIRIRGSAIGPSGTGHHILIFGGAVARAVHQPNIVGKVVTGLEGECLNIGSQKILVLHVDRNVVIRVAVTVDIRAQIRIVVGTEEVVVGHQIQLVRCLVAARYRCTVTLPVCRATVWNLFIGMQQIHPHGDVVGDWLVGVQGDTAVFVGTGTYVELIKGIPGAGLFGDAVDGTAGGAPPGEGGAGALGNLDLLQGETLPRGHPRVAQTINKHITPGLMTTDHVPVAKGITVLAGAEGNAWLRRQDFLQIGFARILNLALGQHGDGLWRVGQRFDLAGIPRGPRLVGSAGLGIRIGLQSPVFNLQGVQLEQLLILRHSQRAHQRCGQPQCQGAASMLGRITNSAGGGAQTSGFHEVTGVRCHSFSFFWLSGNERVLDGNGEGQSLPGHGFGNRRHGIGPLQHVEGSLIQTGVTGPSLDAGADHLAALVDRKLDHHHALDFFFLQFRWVILVLV